MAHLAQREERQHERNEVNETIFGHVADHEAHQHVNACSRRSTPSDNGMQRTTMGAR